MSNDDSASQEGGVVVSNPWAGLRRLTPARIALGRAGTSLPTKPHLEFQVAHALARDAVHRELDISSLKAALEARGETVIPLASAAGNRAAYLQRPDQGRKLGAESRALLQGVAKPARSYDVAFVIGDGLSALAIETNVLPFWDVLKPAVAAGGWTVAPITIVKGARVAAGDEVGQLLGASLVVMLIGERPGLSSPDSMGLYMTYAPRVGLTDEARNCISNVRREGMSYEEAAHKLLYLMTEARKRSLSGVMLKDEAESLPALSKQPSKPFLISG